MVDGQIKKHDAQPLWGGRFIHREPRFMDDCEWSKKDTKEPTR